MASSTSAAVKTPLRPGRGFRVTPLSAAGAPDSLRTMWALSSIRTRSPGSVWARTPIWLDIVPVGTKTAASLPSSSAVRASSALTVGSSP